MDVFGSADLPQLQEGFLGNSSKETDYNGKAFPCFASHRNCVCVSLVI